MSALLLAAKSSMGPAGTGAHHVVAASKAPARMTTHVRAIVQRGPARCRRRNRWHCSLLATAAQELTRSAFKGLNHKTLLSARHKRRRGALGTLVAQGWRGAAGIFMNPAHLKALHRPTVRLVLPTPLPVPATTRVGQQWPSGTSCAAPGFMAPNSDLAGP